jgi:nitroreductase
METWDAYLRRRDTREFADRPVDPEHLDRVLEAGRRAPSGANRQVWNFIIVTDPEQKRQLPEVWTGAGHMADAPAVIALITPVDDDPYRSRTNIYDLGQAAMAMMIVAADLGVATGHSSVREQDKARSILGFPDDQYCAYLISVGYPVSGELHPVRLDRRPFDDVVHRDRW